MDYANRVAQSQTVVGAVPGPRAAALTKASAAEARPADVWNDLRPLFCNRKIGFPAVIVFGCFWEDLGCQPGELTVNVAKYGKSKGIGRDGHSLRDAIAKLDKFTNLVKVKWRSKSGTYQIYVYRPLPEHAEARPDPQRQLPGFDECPIISGMGGHCAYSAGRHRRGTSMLRSKRRSSTPRPTGRRARENPAGLRGEPRGENPAALHAADGTITPSEKPQFSAENLPSTAAPSPTGEPAGFSPRGFPRGVFPAQSPQGCMQSTTHAPASLDSKKKINQLNGSNEPKSLNESNDVPPSEARFLAEANARLKRAQGAGGPRPDGAPCYRS